MLILALSNPSCDANLKIASPPESMTLKHIQVVTRHGLSAPSTTYLDREISGYWLCDAPDALSHRSFASPSSQYRYFQMSLEDSASDYLPNCRVGDLTTRGMKMHEKIGQAYHKFLASIGYLSDNLDPTQFSFISSPIERAYRSAQSFIAGMYPPESDNEVIEIKTGSVEQNSMYPDDHFCEGIRNSSKEFEESDEYTSITNIYWSDLQIIANKLGVDQNTRSLVKMCDWVVNFNCGGGVLDEITDTVLEKCNEIGAFDQFNRSLVDPSTVVSYILKDLLLDMEKMPAKFALFSAHSTTLSVLLAFLAPSMRHASIPPFASHLAVELWADTDGNQKIRFSYNGTPVVIEHFNADLVDYAAFKAYAQAQIEDKCPEVPI